MKNRRWTRSLAVGLAIFLLVGSVAAVFLSRAQTGGQIETSPDGKFRIEVFRTMALLSSVPYRITLRNVNTERMIKQLQINPIDGIPNQELRGTERAIIWSKDSSLADIVLDGRKVCRVFTE